MTTQTHTPIELFKADSFTAPEAPSARLVLPNDADPRDASLDGISVVELQFPKFSDGRAFSQAFLLRRRLGFTGQIRATGDVLIDQLVHMQRSGFTSAVLAEGVNAGAAQRQFDRYSAFYQGDLLEPRPLFARQPLRDAA